MEPQARSITCAVAAWFVLDFLVVALLSGLGEWGSFIGYVIWIGVTTLLAFAAWWFWDRR
jgi:hypothetical protein